MVMKKLEVKDDTFRPFQLVRKESPSSPGKIVEEVCSIVVGLISRAGAG